VNLCAHAWIVEKFPIFCTGLYRSQKQLKMGTSDGVFVIAVQFKRHNFGQCESFRGLVDIPSRSECTHSFTEEFVTPSACRHNVSWNIWHLVDNGCFFMPPYIIYIYIINNSQNWEGITNNIVFLLLTKPTSVITAHFLNSEQYWPNVSELSLLNNVSWLRRPPTWQTFCLCRLYMMQEALG